MANDETPPTATDPSVAPPSQERVTTCEGGVVNCPLTAHGPLCAFGLTTEGADAGQPTLSPAAPTAGARAGETASDPRIATDSADAPAGETGWVGCDPMENGYDPAAVERMYRTRIRELEAALAALETRAREAETELERWQHIAVEWADWYDKTHDENVALRASLAAAETERDALREAATPVLDGFVRYLDRDGRVKYNPENHSAVKALRSVLAARAPRGSPDEAGILARVRRERDAAQRRLEEVALERDQWKERALAREVEIEHLYVSAVRGRIAAKTADAAWRELARTCIETYAQHAVGCEYPSGPINTVCTCGLHDRVRELSAFQRDGTTDDATRDVWAPSGR